MGARTTRPDSDKRFCLRNILPWANNNIPRAKYIMVLTFRQLSFDTLHFPAGSRVPERTSLFEANPYLIGGRLAVLDFDEQRILRWLMSIEPIRSLIIEELGRNRSAFVRTEVVKPFYAIGEGEIDLLVCDQHMPTE